MPAAIRVGPSTAAAMNRMPARGTGDEDGSTSWPWPLAFAAVSRPQRGQNFAVAGTDFEQDVQRCLAMAWLIVPFRREPHITIWPGGSNDQACRFGAAACVRVGHSAGQTS